MKRRKTLLQVGQIIVVIILILSAYSNTFNSPPVLDDYHSFVLNDSVHVDAINKETLRRLSGSYFGVARLIPMLSFAFDFVWGRGDVKAFHVTNLVIHMLSFLACFWLATILIKVSSCQKFGQPKTSKKR